MSKTQREMKIKVVKRDFEEGKCLIASLKKRGFDLNSVARILSASAVIMTKRRRITIDDSAEWFQAAMLELDRDIELGILKVTTSTWADLFPNGREIFYEGDDPVGIVEEIRAKFGFDPSADQGWAETYTKDDGTQSEPFRQFLCPPEHLDEIYTTDKYHMGS